MNPPFLTAQAADPFDPAPMLIHADWLEERGEVDAAESIRALARAGIPSLVAIALMAGNEPLFKYGHLADMGWGLQDGLGETNAIGAGAAEGFARHEQDGRLEPHGCSIECQEAWDGEGASDSYLRLTNCRDIQLLGRSLQGSPLPFFFANLAQGMQREGESDRR